MYECSRASFRILALTSSLTGSRPPSGATMKRRATRPAVAALSMKTPVRVRRSHYRNKVGTAQLLEVSSTAVRCHGRLRRHDDTTTRRHDVNAPATTERLGIS